jgi:hypothetical protein
MASGGMDFAEYLLKRAILVGVVLLVATIALVTVLKRFGPAAGPGRGPLGGGPPAVAPAASGVELMVDFGDGFSKRFVGLPAREAETVLSVLQSAGEAGRRGRLEIDVTGSGEMAFVRSIDGVNNQGGAAGARNWQFWVNGERGRVGAGVAPVRPGDRIEWVLATDASDRAQGPK